MNRRNLLLSVALLALFSALGAGITVYANVRSAIALEGGSLLSATAVTLDAPKALETVDLDGNNVSGRLFQDLDDSGHLRMVRTLGQPEPLPIHEGRQIHAQDQGVALIGDQVETRSNDGQRYVDYDGHAFLVIGRLGVRADSGLAHDVLLQDQKLAVVDAPIVIDVEGGIQALPAIRPSTVEPIGGRTDQRTNIDYISPIVITCGWGLTLFGATASGWLIAGYRRPLAALQYRLGLRRPRVLALNVLPLASITALLFVTVWTVALASAGVLRSTPEFAAAAAAPLALSLMVSTGALTASLWGRSR